MADERRSASDLYDIERELGRGGMGCTYVVRARSNHQRYVLKELLIEQVDNWKSLELFERELAALRALEHPGIPKLVDVIEGEEGRVTGLVQELIEGETVQQMMEAGPLGLDQLERILAECLEILAYLRSRVPPVVHRDITPRNVMVDRVGAHLIDFGSVKWAVSGSTALTSVGTFGYMAPEQMMGRPQPASDMYALGMTLVALASRRDPAEFQVDDATGRVDVRRQLELPDWFEEILERMTAPGLAERLSDPREALRLLGERGSALVPVGRAAEVAKVAPNRAVAVVSLALIAVAAGAVFVLSSAPDAPPPVPAASTPMVDVPAVAEPALPTPVPVPTPVVPAKVAKPVEVVPAEPVPLSEDFAVLGVESQVPGAVVSIDGKVVGVTPLDARVQQGAHRVVVEQDGKVTAMPVVVWEDLRLSVGF
ncbi:MAG: hypothetical protein AUK47_05095 [Deltaproteobacteria bacterium CG2_30_63_29]|nr:MAG: hypothetical protein AUK47_05095 [Deltaproteobacteria bacterium CG2_30_63_29]PJB35174.1 MAG: hypothetical protein CO108_26345 [Deltaproteobacteria bacterium CG_4_9_14_3_um_filter_63_12]